LTIGHNRRIEKPPEALILIDAPALTVIVALHDVLRAPANDEHDVELELGYVDADDVHGTSNKMAEFRLS